MKSGPASFVADGDLSEWKGREAQARGRSADLLVGSTTQGLFIALRSDAPSRSGPCKLALTLATPAPALPALGIDRGFAFDSYETEGSCAGGDPPPTPALVAKCKAWRERQLERRKALTARFARNVDLPCAAGPGGVEARLPFGELPDLTTPSLTSLQLDLPELGLSTALTFESAPDIAGAGTRLEAFLRSKLVLDETAVQLFSPRSPSQLTYFYTPRDEAPFTADSPATLDVDLSKSTRVAAFADVTIDRIERAEPPFAGADRARLVIAKSGKVTEVLTTGREKAAALSRKTGVDLVFAFAGNPTPRATKEYNVASARALHVGESGRAGEPYWRTEFEAELSPDGRLLCRYEKATLSSDGKKIDLKGTGRCRKTFHFDDKTETWVESSVP